MVLHSFVHKKTDRCSSANNEKKMMVGFQKLETFSDADGWVDALKHSGNTRSNSVFRMLKISETNCSGKTQEALLTSPLLC